MRFKALFFVLVVAILFCYGETAFGQLVTPQGKMTSAMEAEEEFNIKEEGPLRMEPITLHPFFGVDYSYNSNIREDTYHKVEDDTVTFINAGIGIAVTNETFPMAFGYSIAWSWFTENEEEDTVTQKGFAQIKYVGENLGAYFRILYYKNAQGSAVTTDSLSTTSLAETLGIEYKLGPFLGTEDAIIFAEATRTDQFGDVDEGIFEAMFGLKGRLTERITFLAQGGPHVRGIIHPSNYSDYQGAVFKVTADYQIDEFTRFVLMGRSFLEDDTFANSGYKYVFSLETDLERQITEELSGRFVFFINWEDYPRIDPNTSRERFDQRYAINVSLAYNVTENVTIDLGYELIWLRSNLAYYNTEVQNISGGITIGL
jgi:hypothetical protein